MNFFNLFKKLTKEPLVRLLVTIIILLSIFLYIRSFEQSSIPLEGFQNSQAILTAVPIVILSLSLHGTSWFLILKALGVSTSFIESNYLYFTSLLARYIPGNLWHIGFRTIMGQERGINSDISMLGITLELGFTVVTGAVITITGAITSKIIIQQKFFNLILWILALGLTIGLAVAVFAKLREDKMSIQIEKSTSLISIVKQALNRLRKFPKGLLIAIILLFLTAWIFQGLAFFLIVNAWKTVPESFLLVFIPVYAAGWLIGFLNPLTPSGIGTRETIFLGTLPSLISPTVVLSSSMLMRLTGLIAELALTTVYWIILRVSKKQKGY